MSSKTFYASKPKRNKPVIHNKYRPNARIVLAPGNSLSLLESIPDEKINLIVTSPPYNIDKEYETRVSLDEYLDNMSQVIKEMTRVLHKDGSICWQVGNYVENNELFPLDLYYFDLFNKAGYKLRNRIVWHFGHGLHIERRFSGRYEMLLWFTKSDSYTFNLDAVRVASKYPGKRHYRGDKKGQPSGNPKGKNPSDVWEIIAQEWKDGFWNIPNVKAHHREKTEHPCQFPIEVGERCVLALSNEDDWILDPFAGVGSSLLGALMHNRRAIGFEQHAPYVAIAKERIKALFAGQLPYRPLGTPVYEPKATERVARLPEEWSSSTPETNGAAHTNGHESTSIVPSSNEVTSSNGQVKMLHVNGRASILENEQPSIVLMDADGKIAENVISSQGL